MPTDTQTKLQILRDNPHVIAVFDQPHTHLPPLEILIDHDSATRSVKLPTTLANHSITVRRTTKLKTLTLPKAQADTTCYNEPVPAGVQIQPDGLTWVGTFGAPCAYLNDDGDRRYGILSNWHVLSSGQAIRGHTIHQPTDHFPALATLDRYLPVGPDITNIFDAALADAKIDGKHTIATQIHFTGEFSHEIKQPTIGMNVRKTGRTTGLTLATCTAIDACVRVSYGDFTASFCGQAIFENGAGPFSAPGDSGSLILTASPFHPCALLFAGNDELTVGSPLAPIVDHFSLSFKFPE